MKSRRACFLLGICVSCCCLVAAEESAPSVNDEIKNILQSGNLARLQALAAKTPGIHGKMNSAPVRGEAE